MTGILFFQSTSTKPEGEEKGEIWLRHGHRWKTGEKNLTEIILNALHGKAQFLQVCTADCSVL